MTKVIRIACNMCGDDVGDSESRAFLCLQNSSGSRGSVELDLCGPCYEKLEVFYLNGDQPPRKTKSTKHAEGSTYKSQRGRKRPNDETMRRRSELRPIREWAEKQGVPCRTGKIPHSIMLAYEKRDEG